MVGHVELGALPFGVIKDSSAVGQIDVILLHGTAAGLRGGATPKGAAEAILFKHLNIRWNKVWMVLLNYVKAVENVEFVVPNVSRCPRTSAKGWALVALEGRLGLNQTAGPQFYLRPGRGSRAEGSKVVALPNFILNLPE